MTEKLVVKSFGPISSVELDIGKITVLIGEQASGKSTICKIISLCRYFSFITNSNKQSLTRKGILVQNDLIDWGLDEYVSEESYWFYENQDYSVEVRCFNDSVENHISEDQISTNIHQFFKPKLQAKSARFKTLLKTYQELYGLTIPHTIPHTFLSSDVKDVMDNPFYFPTERGLQSVFSLGKSSIQNLNDALFNQFALLDNVLKKYQSETEISPLNIIYKNSNGVGFVRESSSRDFFKLSNSASGYQSVIPVVLAVNYYSEIEKRKRTFIVEEPELNLFPKAQKLLVEFFIEQVKKEDHRFILTTHSPYILTALENPIYAQYLSTKNENQYDEEISVTVPNRLWIDYSDVQVYALIDGEQRNLMDREEHLINKDYLDSVSETVNKTFDDLLKLDFKFSPEDDE